MVSPAVRREGVSLLQGLSLKLSQRKLCRLVKSHRSTQRDVQKRSSMDKLCEELRILAYERPRFGYRRRYILLRQCGFNIGIKRFYRCYRQEGLNIQRKRPKRVRHTVRQP